MVKNESKQTIKSLTLIDAAGAAVRTLQPSTIKKEVQLDLKGVAAGVYSLQLAVGSEVLVKQVMVK